MFDRQSVLTETALRDALPGFFSELESALSQDAHQSLLEQLPALVITSRCGCDETGCASFDVGPSRELNIVEQRVMELRHGSSISLPSVKGMVVIDTDNFGRIASIEVLNRKDLAKALKKSDVPARQS